MASTFLLDRTAWDLALDSSRNIALATFPYSALQDVSSAGRLFYGESYYGKQRGIRYFETVLGEFQPIAVLKAQLVAAALTVPEVVSASAALSAITMREVQGQIQVKLSDGSTAVASL